VFGGIDRDTRECFAVLVKKRDAATLLPIIHQFILPETTIHSDQWAAYNNISAGPENYARQTVNHSLHFADSETHAHTQNIEIMWMCIKRKKKQQMGQHNSLLPTHLAEFMWRRKFGDRPLENLIRCIHDLYSVL
jgi:transposase-like protein